MKNNYLKPLFVSAVATATALSFSSCRVEKTQEGEMPKVDVDVTTEEGQMPKFDVDGPDVDVGTKTKTIEVEVPTVDVELPKETNQEPEANAE